jgi:hypothetical protein
MRMNKLAQALGLAMLLASTHAAAQTSKELYAQYNKAYDEKRFEDAAKIALSSLPVARKKANAYYSAAGAFALAGKADEAFKYLQAALDEGLDALHPPADDTDFASLHGDPRWQQVLASYDKVHPEAKIVPLLMDTKQPGSVRYFAGRKAIEQGAQTSETMSMFNQYYAGAAQSVGEYDEANRMYGDMGESKGGDPVGELYMRAVDAVPVVLASAHGRQAVFLNESHGQSQTRAANYALLAGLRADGFDVLAIETLTGTPMVQRDAAHCSSTSMLDTGLARRGYPTAESGYYMSDPVFGEIVREALRLGFRLVAYDAYSDGSVAEREQDQAENLACVFKENPKARMVVLAGFDHIAETKDYWVPGGAMAYRFHQLTGIDPLSVDTTRLTFVDQAYLKFAGDKPAPSYLLQNSVGETYKLGEFDLSLFVPAPSHRNDGQPSWLELGGARHRVAVARSECKAADPCLVDARRLGEDPKAVPGDRCVLSANEDSCTLFLAPGRYEISTFDDAGAEISRRQQEVPGGR